MEVTENFNEWMKNMKNQYYFDNEKMTNAYDRLIKLNENKNIEI
jgi:hypothetical protein